MLFCFAVTMGGMIGICHLILQATKLWMVIFYPDWNLMAYRGI